MTRRLVVALGAALLVVAALHANRPLMLHEAMLVGAVAAFVATAIVEWG